MHIEVETQKERSPSTSIQRNVGIVAPQGGGGGLYNNRFVTKLLQIHFQHVPRVTWDAQ